MCPSCTSSSLTQLYESRFDRSPIADYLEESYSRRGGVVFDQLRGAVYALLQCQDCKLIFQRDVLNDVLMHKLYEDWIDPSKDLQIHLEEYGSEVYGSHAQEIMRLIAHFGKPPSSLQVLDFGMGWSEWALLAKGFGCDAWGTDISDSRIDYAKSKGVQVLTGKEKTPLKFDFINTEKVFEHLSDPLETLLELKKLLKPGGIIKISVINSRSMNRRLKHMDWRANRWSALFPGGGRPARAHQLFSTRIHRKNGAACGIKGSKNSAENSVPVHGQLRRLAEVSPEFCAARLSHCIEIKIELRFLHAVDLKGNTGIPVLRLQRLP